MRIRQIKRAEYGVLADFLYYVVYVAPGEEPLPRDIITKPGIAVYINNFGEKSDYGVVAEDDGRIVGAAWVRVIAAYGHVDAKTPELVMSVLPEYRGKGVGTKMLKKLFALLVEQGYKKVSLSVHRDNPAFRLYERMGYKTIREDEPYYIMVKSLLEERDYGTSIAVSLGVGFGIALGVVFNNFGFWLPIGACVGIFMGAAWVALKNKEFR